MIFDIGVVTNKTDKTMTQQELKDSINGNKELTFVIMPTKNKRYERTLYCKDFSHALSTQIGMMYALYFEYKHPTSEMWVDGQLVHSMR